jgi:hypothetical protein
LLLALVSSHRDNRDVNEAIQPPVEGRAQGFGLSPAWRRVSPVVLKVLLAISTLLLLGSVGGAAVYAAPVTLPALFLAARFSRRTSEGILWAVLAGATALETVWLLSFVTLGEATPWVWLLPVLAAMTVGAVVFGAYATRSTSG